MKTTLNKALKSRDLLRKSISEVVGIDSISIAKDDDKMNFVISVHIDELYFNSVQIPIEIGGVKIVKQKSSRLILQ